MTRIGWTRIAPGDIEHLVAMLLCRENPAAKNIRPSRGDGGIDVLVPADDSSFIVYQVKSFSSNLDASQKGQVERSFYRLLDFAKARGLRVIEWYLTLPLNPTDPNLFDWFAAFTTGHGLHADWRGLNFVEGLAGTYPSVVDYYLHDGKDRLQAALGSLTEVLRMSMRIRPAAVHSESTADTLTDPLAPAEMTGSLAAVHAMLNEHDPHFYYDFSVDTTRPGIPEQPGLVAAVQDSDGKRWVTFKVFAWCSESLVERPIPLNLTITADSDGDLRRDTQAFEKYGRPFTAPTGTVHGELGLPGGLGGSIARASLSIGPAGGASSGTYDIRLQLLDETGELLTETQVHMESPSAGLRQQGARAHGTEANGAFTFESLLDLGTQTATFTVGHLDLTGKVPGLLLPGLRLRREFHYPHQLRIAAPFGLATHAPVPIPSTATPDSADGLLFDLVEALAIVQEHTSTQIRIPDFRNVTLGEMQPVLRAAELLRGATLSAPWNPLTIHIRPGAAISTQPMSVLLYYELKVSIDGVDVGLGYEQVYLPSARMDIESLTGHDDHQDIRIIPVGGTAALIRHQPRIPIAHP
jgi:hypothetical protein